jgi:hypothetical protein
MILSYPEYLKLYNYHSVNLSDVMTHHSVMILFFIGNSSLLYENNNRIM